MIKPIRDSILVTKREVKNTTEAGIILPDQFKNTLVEGDVVAVGSGIISDGKIIPLDVKVGDVIIFNVGAGIEIQHEDTKYYLLKEPYIFAVLD